MPEPPIVEEYRSLLRRGFSPAQADRLVYLRILVEEGAVSEDPREVEEYRRFVEAEQLAVRRAQQQAAQRRVRQSGRPVLRGTVRLPKPQRQRIAGRRRQAPVTARLLPLLLVVLVTSGMYGLLMLSWTLTGE